MLGLVTLTDYLNRNYDPADISGPLAPLASPTAAFVFKMLSLGELLADKMPFTPNRTFSWSLFGRMMWGMVCGAALTSARRQSVITGIVVGGLAAFIGTFLTYNLRKFIAEGLGLRQLLAGAAEDVLLISGAARLFENEFIIEN